MVKLLATVVLGGSLIIPPPIHAPDPISGHAVFCAAWAVWGDTPSYGNLLRIHGLAPRAGTVTHRRERRFEAVLLAGYPTEMIRAASDAVWSACGD